MILDWKLVSQKIDKQVKQFIAKNKSFFENKYIAIFLLNEDIASRAYVNMKKKKWELLWIKVKIIEEINQKKLSKVIEKINRFNKDQDCIWIIIQLPLNRYLQPFLPEILISVDFKKDIDWLWWALFGFSQIWYIDFIPATPRAVLEIFDYYNVDIRWKNIVIIGQSNLIWKPLSLELMKKWGSVFSFNEFSDKILMKKICQQSDIIISATWKLHLVDESFINKDRKQILIDVWWWKLNWKPTWDINFESVYKLVKAITPVPGGVWPVTVSAIFANLTDLLKYFYKEIV